MTSAIPPAPQGRGRTNFPGGSPAGDPGRFGAVIDPMLARTGGGNTTSKAPAARGSGTAGGSTPPAGHARAASAGAPVDPQEAEAVSGEAPTASADAGATSSEAGIPPDDVVEPAKDSDGAGTEAAMTTAVVVATPVADPANSASALPLSGVSDDSTAEGLSVAAPGKGEGNSTASRTPPARGTDAGSVAIPVAAQPSTEDAPAATQVEDAPAPPIGSEATEPRIASPHSAVARDAAAAMHESTPPIAAPEDEPSAAPAFDAAGPSGEATAAAPRSAPEAGPPSRAARNEPSGSRFAIEATPVSSEPSAVQAAGHAAFGDTADGDANQNAGRQAHAANENVGPASAGAVPLPAPTSSINASGGAVHGLPDGTASHTASAAEDPVVPQLVKALHVQLRNGVGEARVQLEPHHLGAVSVTLRVDQGVVSAVITAEHAAVRHWLETHESSLRGALTEQGLQLDRLRVEPDGHQNTGRDAAGHEPPPRRRLLRKETATFELVA